MQEAQHSVFYGPLWFGVCNRIMRSSCTSLCLALLLALSVRAFAIEPGDTRSQDQRREMTERGLQFLSSIQKDGALGDSRQRAVTALHVLACLSSGVQPTHPVHGASVRAACDWLLVNSSKSFLGGTEEPNADHAIVLLALSELVGTAAAATNNLALYEKSRTALQYSLEIQDDGTDPRHTGGWKPDDRTRVNDRMLTTWFLWTLYAGQLLDEKIPKSSVERAVEFVLASQKDATAEKEDERGGFSIGAAGLPVRSATAAGMAAIALFDPDKTRLDLARSWLARHPPNWYGPHFYATHFFAVRALYRAREADGGKAFAAYFQRVVRLLRERQQADGSFPYPPGEGGPVVAMGPGYSTAMAILILNADRGFLPVDQ